jgi:hypothetical protein
MEENMFDENYYLIDELKKKIYENYPSININAVCNEEDEYFLSIDNRELYYSEGFQLFLMSLKRDMLWKKNIYNIYFSLDEIANRINNITSDRSGTREAASRHKKGIYGCPACSAE